DALPLSAFVALESELLVRATETLVERFGLSQLFLGLIVIPLIGNAAEHATAVVVARRGQTDLAAHPPPSSGRGGARRISRCTSRSAPARRSRSSSLRCSWGSGRF